MNLSISGLPALVVQVGFIAVFSAPVWLAAKIVGAERPTLIRAALSLFVGVIGSIVAIVVGGGWALLLVPLAFLLGFKLIQCAADPVVQGGVNSADGEAVPGRRF